MTQRVVQRSPREPRSGGIPLARRVSAGNPGAHNHKSRGYRARTIALAMLFSALCALPAALCTAATLFVTNERAGTVSAIDTGTAKITNT